MKKLHLITLAVVFLITLSGCDTTAVQSSQNLASQKQEQIQKTLTEAVPIPEITTSSTRLAISRRATLFNDENKITYVYLISYGKVMAFYPVSGQVVSLRSYLTPMENIVNRNGVLCKTASSGSNSEPRCSETSGSGYLVSAPDLDGTYGDNPDGIFFFTTENAYVEWRGEYMVSDQPLKLTTQPELVRQIK